jgi:RimJ/RimL family protein N-acetyltransferase
VDAVDIMVLAGDRRVSRMLGSIPHPYRLADAFSWIAMPRGSASRAIREDFVIFLKPDRKTLVGSCGFSQIGADPIPHLGYWIGAPYWGQGYVSEAAHAVLAYAFEDCGLDMIQSGAQVANPASRAVLEKLGFRHLGTGLFYSSARKRNEIIDKFLLTAEEWRRKDQGKIANARAMKP